MNTQKLGENLIVARELMNTIGQKFEETVQLGGQATEALQKERYELSRITRHLVDQYGYKETPEMPPADFVVGKLIELEKFLGELKKLARFESEEEHGDPIMFILRVFENELLRTEELAAERVS